MDQIEAATAFLQAVVSDDASGALVLTSPVYREHDPSGQDGIAGLADRLGRAADGDRFAVIRVLQDDAFVVVQAEGSRRGKRVLFDVFRFAGELIAEHWGFSSATGSPNKSGHSQESGPTESTPGSDATRSKSLIRDYYGTVHVGGQHDDLVRYVAQDTIRHEPDVSDGLAAFVRDLKAATRFGPASRSIDEIRLLLGQGDTVFVAAKGSIRGRPAVFVDLYRVENDKIAEHWGFAQATSLKELAGGRMGKRTAAIAGGVVAGLVTTGIMYLGRKSGALTKTLDRDAVDWIAKNTGSRAVIGEAGTDAVEFVNHLGASAVFAAIYPTLRERFPTVPPAVLATLYGTALYAVNIAGVAPLLGITKGEVAAGPRKATERWAIHVLQVVVTALVAEGTMQDRGG